MARIALVQNQSEMRHNAYADARAAIEELGHEAHLFTGDDADALAGALRAGGYDALMLGSNALNDQAVQAALAGHETRAALDAFLEGGGGVLCFHQLKLSEGGRELGFLPAPWSSIRARRLEKGEQAGELEFEPGAESHPTLLFPSVVDCAALTKHAAEFTPQPTLFHHWWEGASAADWTVLISDRSGPTARPLVVLSRDATAARRIVLSALPADWQQSPALLENLLCYAAEGAVTTALVSPSKKDPAIEFIERWLQAQHWGLRSYKTEKSSDLDALETRLRSGVHRTIVLAPGLELADLSKGLRELIVAGLEKGRLRLLGFGDPVGGRQRLWLASRQLSARALLENIVAQVLGELSSGYVEDSFWATVESLQVLDELEERPVELTEERAAKAVERAIAARDPDGSYDSTVAATCGLLWLLNRFGHKADVPETSTWLRECGARRTDGPFHAEAVQALTALVECSVATADDRVQLEELLSESDPTEVAELDLARALRGALALESDDLTSRFGTALADKQKDGTWLDLATTAAVMKLLDRSRQHLGADRVERALFPAAVHLRRNANPNIRYPWGGRPDTTLLCLQALLEYNARLDLPITDVISAIGAGDVFAKQNAAGNAAIEVVDALRAEKAGLEAQVRALDIKVSTEVDATESAKQRAQAATARANRARVARNRTWVGAGILGYLLVSLVGGAAATDKGGLSPLLDKAFDKPAPLHGVVVALIVGVFVIAAVVRLWRDDVNDESVDADRGDD